MDSYHSERNIGKRIARLRKNKGLSARKLARLSGVSQAYISQIENGVYSNPHPDILEKLARVLEVTHMELMLEAGLIKETDHLEKSIESNKLKLVKRKNKALKTDKKLTGIHQNIELIRKNIQETNDLEEKEQLTADLMAFLTKLELEQTKTVSLMEEIAVLRVELHRQMELYQALKMERMNLSNISLDQCLNADTNITFNGKELTAEDKEKVYQMLSIMFG